MEKLILDGHKLNWHQERVEAWLRGERIAPITVDCALTRRCTASHPGTLISFKTMAILVMLKLKEIAI